MSPTPSWSGESDSKPDGDWEQWPAETVAILAQSREAGTESSHGAAASSSQGAGGQPEAASGAATYVFIRPAVAETVAI